MKLNTQKSWEEAPTDAKHPGAPVVDAALQKGAPDSDPAQTETRETEQSGGGQWTSSIPQVASEDIINIGNGRYAHFRRDRRFAQVQVVFTAPEGADPNPGRKLTDQFKELGWIWRGKDPGKPWIYQLEQSSKDDPTARGDSRDALHEQFLIIIQEYRENQGIPPTIGWRNLLESEPKTLNTESRRLSNRPLADQAATINEKQKLPSPEEETRAGGPEPEMLDAFASVGAQQFDITWTDAGGDKVGFRGNHPFDRLRSAMPAILQKAAEQKHNVIVRPRSSDATLIQLDDLGEEATARLRPVSFLILRTSPGNYQAWVAVSDADTEFARRLRKGAGADLTASGATRVSGSMNFKERYAPAFPRVETVHVNPGLIVTKAELEALGVVTPPESAPSASVHRGCPRRGVRAWPSYQRCVENAPPARGGGRPDISRADYTFCLLALDWGWSMEETAERLMQESGKAQENGEAYALRTARNAAAALERRQGKQR